MAGSKTGDGNGMGAAIASCLLGCLLLVITLTAASSIDADTGGHAEVMLGQLAQSSSRGESVHHREAFLHGETHPDRSLPVRAGVACSPIPCAATGCDLVCASVCPAVTAASGTDAVAAAPRRRDIVHVRPEDASLVDADLPGTPLRPPIAT